MTTTILKASVALAALAALSGSALAQTTLTIESWRNDDLATWQEKIIPAFEAQHPDIKVTFAPTAPTEYNSALAAKLDAGSAGDLVACRPFDASLGLYQKKQLADLTKLPAWRTSRGRPHRLVDRRRLADLLRADGRRPPRLHVQQEGLRGARCPAAEDRGRVLRPPRQDQGERHLRAAGHGHQGPVGSRDHGLPEHRPELLEGRGRPESPDRRHPEADRRGLGEALRDARQVGPLHGRRLPGADLSRQPEPLHARPRGDLPAGSWEIATFEAQADFEIGAFLPPSRTPAIPATSPTTRTSRSASTPPPRTPRPPRPSSPGWRAPSSRRSTPTPRRASSR